MRCLTLADALAGFGARCRFVSREQDGDLIDLIRARKHDVVAIPASSAGGWATDAGFTAAAVAGADWLVVDHYLLDYRWEERIRSTVGHVMAIDDLADRRHVCDLLLDQTLGRSVVDYSGLVPIRCQLLLGPRYSLLRPRFGELRGEALARREGDHRTAILVGMGGVDHPNLTGRIIAALVESLEPEVCVTVVLGRHSPHVEAVRALASQRPPQRMRVLVDVDDMARLMADADFAIGAGGGSAWERCCMGLPSIIVPIADNQVSVARALAAAGAALVLSPDAVEDGRLVEATTRLLADRAALRRMAAAAAAITDGTGVVATCGALREER